MVNVRQLYTLQELDLELERKQAELARLQAELGETRELLEARQLVQREERSLTQSEGERKVLELELGGVEEKRSSIERRLYEGSVRSPKELMGMHEEQAFIERRKRELEDRTLEVMMTTESQQSRYQKLQLELRSEETRWQVEQQRLHESMARIQTELRELATQREGVKPTIDPALLSRYEALRPVKQGVAVAKAERGLCQGCRINIPSSDLQKAKIGREVVLCNSCGRLLFVS